MGTLTPQPRTPHRLLLFAAALLVTACSQDVSTQTRGDANVDRTAPALIRIGVAQPAPGNPPVFTVGSLGIAYTKGWLAEEFDKTNTRVDLTFFKGAGPAVNEALANGQLDFAFQGDLPAIIARALGLETRVILATGVRGNIYVAVPRDSELTTIESLAGKRVAFFKGTNVQLPLNRLLEAHGLTEKSLRAINLDTAAGQAAILTGDIDALVGGTELLRLRDEAGVRILYGSQTDSPIFTRQAHVLVTKAFADAYPAATQRLVDVLVQSARWASDEANRDEVLDLWEQSGLPRRYWEEDMAGETLRTRSSPLLDPFFVRRYEDAVAETLRLRLTRTTFPVSDWLDPSYLENALDRLGLRDFWQPVDANGRSLGRVSP